MLLRSNPLVLSNTLNAFLSRALSFSFKAAKRVASDSLNGDEEEEDVFLEWKREFDGFVDEEEEVDFLMELDSTTNTTSLSSSSSMKSSKFSSSSSSLLLFAGFPPFVGFPLFFDLFFSLVASLLF